MTSKNLIIYAHPNKETHAGYTLTQFCKELEAKNENYEILDLYKNNFSPLLKAEELYSNGQYAVTEETKQAQKLIKEANNIAFIFPIWWQGPPAILKGFFDRVLLPHFAFSYENKIPVGLLKGKKAVVLTTTGAPRFFTKLFYQDRALKVITSNTLSFCGIKTKGFQVDNAKTFNDKQKEKINKKIKQALKFFKL